MISYNSSGTRFKIRFGSEAWYNNNLTCIHPNCGFRITVPQQVSHRSEHSDFLPMLKPPTSEHTDPHPMHGSQILGSLTTGTKHMDLSKSFVAATEDSWMIIKFGHNRGVHVIYASKKSSKPKRASSEQGISKPDPVFYREVDLSDFPQDIPSTLICTLNDVAGQQELRPKGPSVILHSVLN